MDIANNQFELGASKIVNGLLTSLTIGFGITCGSDIWLVSLNAYKQSKGIPSFSSASEIFHGSLQWTNSSVPSSLPPFGFMGTFTLNEQNVIAAEKMVNGCLRQPNISWWMQPMPWWSMFILLPLINFVASLRRGIKIRSWEMPVSIAISCASQAVTRVVVAKFGLTGHPDYIALMGSFVVSLFGNLYAYFCGRTAFSVMLTGIWLLVPSGLASAGGITSTLQSGQDEYTQALDLARKSASISFLSLSMMF